MFNGIGNLVFLSTPISISSIGVNVKLISFKCLKFGSMFISNKSKLNKSSF